MADGDWMKRLVDAIRAKGLSLREVSLKAGLSKGYIAQAKDGHAMTVANFLKVCEAAGINPAEIILDVPIDAEAVRFLMAWANAPEEMKQLFRSLPGQSPPARMLPKP